jgi:hypothetical protein
MKILGAIPVSRQDADHIAGAGISSLHVPWMLEENF